MFGYKLCLRRATFDSKIQVVIDLNGKNVSRLMKTWELCCGIVLLFAGGSFCPEASQKTRNSEARSSHWGTPRKINMEHNNGGLEDHFPF